MSLRSKQVAGSSSRSSGLKHYFLSAGSSGRHYTPFYYVEAKIDFSDVRSGFRESCSVNRAFEICPFEDDALWTQDMVRAVDPSLLGTDPPAGAVLDPLPASLSPESLRALESRIETYLLRYYSRTVYRNLALNVYSEPGENLGDFCCRCVDLLNEPLRKELDELQEVFERKLDRIKEIHLQEEGGAKFDRARLRSQMANRLHETAERVAEVFLNASLSTDSPANMTPCGDQRLSDLERRLFEIEAESRVAIQRLRSTYLEKTRNNDEYEVHPTLRDIQIGRVAIVWVPVDGGL